MQKHLIRIGKPKLAEDIKYISNFLQNRILGKLVLTFSTSFTLQIIAIFTGILTARILGPTGKGQLTAIIVWSTMLSMVGSLGIIEAINYFTSSQTTSDGKILASGLYLGIIQVISLIGIGWILTPLVLGKQGDYLVLVGRYYLFFIPLNIFTLYLQAYLAGKLRFGAYNLVRLSVSVAIFGGLIILELLGHTSVLTVLIVYLVANTLTLVVVLVSVFLPKVECFVPDRALVRQMLAYGLKAQASSITMMVNERMDQIIIAMTLPAVQLGYYAVAVSMTSGVMIVGASMAMVAMPIIAKTATDAEKVNVISRFFRINLWLSMMTAAVFLSASQALVLLLFGSEFLPAQTPTKILLVAAVPLCANRVLEASLKAINMPMQAGIAEITASVTTVLLLAFLLPSFGIVGAAITSLISYTVSGIYLLIIIRSKLKCPIGELFILKVNDYHYLVDLIQGWKKRTSRSINASEPVTTEDW